MEDSCRAGDEHLDREGLDQSVGSASGFSSDSDIFLVGVPAIKVHLIAVRKQDGRTLLRRDRLLTKRTEFQCRMRLSAHRRTPGTVDTLLR